MGRNFPVIILMTVLISACTTISSTPALAQWEHELSYGMDHHPVDLVVSPLGATFAKGKVDATRYPRLAQAWDAGAAPISPLIGREPALWLRQLQVTPLADTHGQVHLYAKALAPFPIRLSLLAVENNVPVNLGQLDSQAWSAGAHFASVQVDFSAPNDTLLVLRVEGAHQASESWVRVKLPTETLATFQKQ